MDREFVRDVLVSSAQRVLETMFFTCVEAVDELDADPRALRWVEVRFEGDPAGVFHLGVTPEASQAIAENFLGGPASDTQTEQVLAELGNVICGTTLSRLEEDRGFKVLAPRVLACQPGVPAESAVACRLRLDCGQAELRFCLE